MIIFAKDMDYCRLSANGRVTPETNKPITKETIKANIGLLGLRGKHLKSLMKGKTKERLT